MKQIKRDEVKDFVGSVPLIVHMLGSSSSAIGCVGVKWGFCKYANEHFGGKKRVMAILDLLEGDYQDLLAL